MTTNLAQSDAFFKMPEVSFARRVRQWCGRYKIGAISAIFLIALAVAAIFASFVAPHKPDEFVDGAVLASPSWDLWLGGDELGRDVLSRLIWGGRTSLRVGATAVVLASVVGTTIGLVSGMRGGFVDTTVQRFVEIAMAFPPLLLALLLVAVADPGITTIIVAIAVPSTPQFVRVVRASVITTKNTAYVDAARSVGAGPLRIALQHILPNIFAPILVLMSVMAGSALIAEASLSYLGLSIPPPTPTWGGMLSGASRQYFTSAPWMAIAPGILITLVVLSLNMLGDALRDSMDPRLRNR